MNKRLVLALAAFITMTASATFAVESPVTLTIDPADAGPAVSPEFIGLSFEAVQLLPNENGVRYFRPDNQPLLNLYRQLGVRSLRIGGNTSDRDARKLPGEADWDSLFAFAKAADLKVIYNLRLLNGNAEDAARTVKYIMDHYAPQVECFSIGQEPSAYPTEKVDTRANSERMGAGAEKFSYDMYRQSWTQFARVIRAAVPDVKFCGPAVHNNGEWARKFIADFGRSNNVTMCVMHLYAGGAGNKVPTPEIGRDRMLSGEFLKTYQKLHDGFVPMAQSNGLSYRLEEVNNYFNGGATNVSNTFASALWGLEFMHWWAAHGAAGLNFHTGDRVAAGSSLQPSRYTAYHSSPNGYHVRPLGYAIKAFDLGSRGKIAPLKVSSNVQELYLAAFAVLSNRTLFVTLINKEHGSTARDAAVTLQPGVPLRGARIIRLTAPEGDVAATSGVTLGGAEVTEDGNWNGRWEQVSVPNKDELTLTVPAASAAVLELTADAQRQQPRTNVQ